LKVLLIFSSSDIGGAEKSLSKIVASNNDKDIEYVVSTFGGSGAFTEFALKIGLSIEKMSYSYLKLFLYLYRIKPSVVYVIGFRISLVLRFMKFFLPFRYLIQGVRWNPNSSTKLDKVFRFFESNFGSLIDGYIVNSKTTLNTMRSIQNKNIRLIYNGIVSKKNKKHSREKVVLTIANIRERKGYIEYLEAVKIVLDSIPDAKFLFLGKDYLDGKLHQKIRAEKLENNIDILGYKGNVDKYFASSSVFALPSIHGEGCPTSILEAFTNHTPVVAFDIDGVSELVKNNKDGFIVEVKNYKEFASKIISLLNNSEMSIRMGDLGSKKVQLLFSLDKAIDEHNKFFKEFI